MRRLIIFISLIVSTTLSGQIKTLRTFKDTVFNVGDKIYIYQPSYATCNPMFGRPDEIDSLKPVAAFLNSHKNIVFELQSHTDARGNSCKNLKLSRLRAENLKEHLIKYYQVDSLQLIAKGYGSKQLLLTNEVIRSAKTKEEKEAMHAKNRRSVLVVRAIK